LESRRRSKRKRKEKMNKLQLEEGIRQVQYVKEEYKKAVGHYPDQTDLLILMLGVASRELLELNKGMDEVRMELENISGSLSRAGSLQYRG